MDVDSRDIKLFYLYNQYNMNPTPINLEKLQEEEDLRQYFDDKFEQLAMTLGATSQEDIKQLLQTTPPLGDQTCQRAAIRRFEEKC